MFDTETFQARIILSKVGVSEAVVSSQLCLQVATTDRSESGGRIVCVLKNQTNIAFYKVQSLQIRYLNPLVVYIYVNHVVYLSIDLLLEADAGRISFCQKIEPDMTWKCFWEDNEQQWTNQQTILKSKKQIILYLLRMVMEPEYYAEEWSDLTPQSFSENMTECLLGCPWKWS